LRAGQSKTAGRRDLIHAPAAAARLIHQAELRYCNSCCLNHYNTRMERNDMTTSSARALVLGAAIAASMGIGYAIGAQPHMAETITILQSARAELNQATPNKGGHRERALGLIDQAIGEVRAGMAFAAGG
jgi:hypothetical protein